MLVEEGFEVNVASLPAGDDRIRSSAGMVETPTVNDYGGRSRI
jgi:hypothetical protein